MVSDCPLLFHTRDPRCKPWFEHDAQVLTEAQLSSAGLLWQDEAAVVVVVQDDTAGGVSRAIVNNNQILRHAGFAQDACEPLANGGRRIIRRDDDADIRLQRRGRPVERC